MFGIGKRKTKAQLESELDAAHRELSALRAQHKALVARTAYYQNLSIEMGNQVQRWMQMHEEVLKQLGAETPDLKAYADSVAQAIKESYPDPSALVAALAMSLPGTQGSYAPRASIIEADRPAGRLSQLKVTPR